MTDYIFLKISEMALRAIHKPRRGYGCILRSGEIVHFDQWPFHIIRKGGFDGYTFREGTRFHKLDTGYTGIFKCNATIHAFEIHYL